MCVKANTIDRRLIDIRPPFGCQTYVSAPRLRWHTGGPMRRRRPLLLPLSMRLQLLPLRLLLLTSLMLPPEATCSGWHHWHFGVDGVVVGGGRFHVAADVATDVVAAALLLLTLAFPSLSPSSAALCSCCAPCSGRRTDPLSPLRRPQNKRAYLQSAVGNSARRNRRRCRHRRANDAAG